MDAASPEGSLPVAITFPSVLQLHYLVFAQINWKLSLNKILPIQVLSGLFIILRIWKQPRYPSRGELWIVQVTGDHSAKRNGWQAMGTRKEPQMRIAKWKKPVWKATYSTVPTLWLCEKSKTTQTLNTLGAPSCSCRGSDLAPSLCHGWLTADC